MDYTKLHTTELMTGERPMFTASKVRDEDDIIED